MRLYMSLSNMLSSLYLIIMASFMGPFQAPKIVTPIDAPSSRTCRAVVFDLGGVLFDTDKTKSMSEIGAINLFNYWRKSSNADLKNLHERLFSLLNTARGTEGNQWGLKDGTGLPLPEIMAEWMRGMKPNKELYDEVMAFCKNNPDWFKHSAEKRVLQQIVRITFEPAKLVKTRKVYSDTVALIKECKDRGFELYVLSNWDGESSKLLVEKYADIFALFDGIIFSGKVGCAKPEPAIFECLTKTIPAHECVFIDDQAENIKTARQLGFNTILVEHENSILSAYPNIAAVRENLENITPVHEAKTETLNVSNRNLSVLAAL